MGFLDLIVVIGLMLLVNLVNLIELFFFNKISLLGGTNGLKKRLMWSIWTILGVPFWDKKRASYVSIWDS